MEKRLNILAVEDLEDDLFLLLRHLKRNGYTVSSYRVDNEKDLRKAFEKGGWDIIISDFSMPQFNGLKALQIYNDYKLDIPFILLSGTIGEDVAVEAMKLGAHDYIMKDKLGRLVPAIERELKEAKNRREKLIAQNKLKESEEGYRTVVENAFDIIFTISTDGKILRVNEAVKNIGNWEKEDLIGRPISEIIHPEDLRFVQKRMEITLCGMQDGEYEIRLKKKDSSYFIGAMKTTLLKKDGKAEGILGFVRDVTKKKEMEERVTIFSKASNQSPVSIIITDLDGNLSYVNEMFLSVSGFSKDEILNIESKELIASEVSDEDYTKMWLDVKNYGIWKGQYYSKTKKGKLFWEEVSITPIRDEQENIIRFLIIKIDITKRKEMFSELLIAKREAESANNMKSEFLAQMSHEIRTPLNTMLSFHQLFKAELGDELDTDLLYCLDGAENASLRIIRTIDLLLNMTELQVGSYSPNRVYVDVYEDILDKLMLEKFSESKMKGLEFNLSKLTNKTRIKIDEYSVTQIFDNLISNAIKYTNSGKIDINCFINAEGYLSVSVADTGIGIAKENLQKIFHAFSQEEQGYTRSYEGNGLGLALVSEYCKINKAIILVESEKGVGSTFTIVFKF